jgi:signal transduction histidine kinase
MSQTPTMNVLLIEDNSGDARLLREMLKEQESQKIEITHVSCLADAEKHLAETTPDTILIDLGLPDANGLEAVRRVHAAAPGIPMVVLTGMDDEKLATQALQEGAQDYLIKGEIDTRGLLRALRYATERKRVERMKDEFVSSVSHELRTPLTSIAGSLGLIVNMRSPNFPESITRLLEIAHTNSLRLVRLVNDILDIEKMESGRIGFNLSKVDVRTMVKQAVESTRPFAESHKVRIQLKAGSTGDVKADAGRFVQVITNLLSNAIKHSPQDGDVDVTIERSAEAIRISVRDRGAGIPAAFKPLVFERFAQADATNALRKGGTGLGLSIVKQIVKRLSGTVGFDDAPGGGALFFFELPLWEDTASWHTDLDTDVGASRILICEDDRETAIGIRQRLKQAGFPADIVFTAAAARRRAAEFCYAAILVDLQLPDGDGIDLILSIRSQSEYCDTPIAVVSVDPVRGRNDARSSKLKVLGWFSKPIDFEELVHTLKSSIISEPNRRTRVLHVDDDHDILAVVAEALGKSADVVSVDSIEAAKAVLASSRIDLVVLDVALGTSSGLDLMPHFQDSGGKAIPVIVFSAQDLGRPFDKQVQAALEKSDASLQRLVGMVRDHTAPPSAQIGEEVA